MSFAKKAFTKRANKENGGRLPVNPNTSFQWMVGPLDWSLVKIGKTWKFHPMLMSLQEDPGVNGVKSLPGGGTDSSAARHALEQEGFTFIPMSLDYIHEYTTMNGSPYYCDKFTTPTRVGNNIVNKYDKTGLHKFKDDLIKNKIIPVPDDHIKILIEQKIERRISDRIPNQHIPQIANELKELEDMLKNLDKAFAALTQVEV